VSCRLLLPAPLRPLAEGAAEVEAAGATLREVLDDVAVRWPVLERRLRDESGRLRPHVLVFVDGAGVRGAGEQETPVRDGSEVFVAPAVSGGWSLSA
jgi:molybdopterin synthase sulfur carrier subunit